MKPLKNISGLSAWLMRISLLIMIMALFSEEFMKFELNTLSFYISTAFIVFAVLLFSGGFFSAPLTVVSSLVLFALSVINAVIAFNGELELTFVCWILIASVCTYFLTHGNK